MALNVEIISKEMIKPSSPTPCHLRNLKLSFLDQIAPPIYVPIILFFQSDSISDIENSRAQKSRSLKLSLMQNLTRFYPLAGRINDDEVSIECNDAGVEYVEARVHAQISDVIENPDMKELTKFLPINPYDHITNVVILAIQINFFACGGVAVSVCISHKVADGTSLIAFIKSWASESHGAPELIPNPDFHSASRLFPPVNLSGFKPTSGITQEKVVTKRFVFDKMKLARLKQEMTAPTSVEAVSAFFWKQLINASKNKGKEKFYVGVHAVNLRPKINPPLGNHVFGNIWSFASAVSTGEGGDVRDMSYYDEQAQELRNAFRKIDGDYVKKLEDGVGFVEYLKKCSEEYSKGGGYVEFCSFSSWYRFPIYEVDFGWGKPIWVSTSTLPSKNVVFFMSRPFGDGIEATASVVGDDMALLEAEHKLL